MDHHDPQDAEGQAEHDESEYLHDFTPQNMIWDDSALIDAYNAAVEQYKIDHTRSADDDGLRSAQHERALRSSLENMSLSETTLSEEDSPEPNSTGPENEVNGMPEYRMDEGAPYTLPEFIAEYGGDEPNPPKQWVKAEIPDPSRLRILLGMAPEAPEATVEANQAKGLQRTQSGVSEAPPQLDTQQARAKADPKGRAQTSSTNSQFPDQASLRQSQFPKSQRQFPQPQRQFPQPQRLFPQPQRQFPQPQSQFPKPQTQFPQPQSQFPQRQTQFPQSQSQIPQQQPQYSQHTAPQVPPMAALLPEDENLANVVLAWYYAGYYTGIYMSNRC